MKWKFRAWVEDDYYFDRPFMLPQEEIESVTTAGGIEFNGMRYTEKGGNFDGISSECVKIMAFTGLTDRNGVEIYEGDILSLSGKWNNKKLVVVVEYHAPSFCYKFTEYVAKIRNATHEPIFSNTSNAFEVIGNIYENPELLESDNEIECMLKVEKQ